MKERHTYKLGVIGNCSYMAYVDDEARVRWLCWPHFDSPSLFAHLLDQEKGGYFSIRPAAEKWTSKQYYIENTNVLATEFETAEGKFRVIDFAPRFNLYERNFKPNMLMRKVENLSGEPRIVISCKPRGDYGQTEPEVSLGSNHIRYRGLSEMLRLSTNVPLTFAVSEKPLALTETKYFVLCWGIPLEAPLENVVESYLRQTIHYWQNWVAHSAIPSIYQEEVIRSSLVLKLHQFEDTGAIIASGTTSLPESPGSSRNWDYRYCWMRDSYYTLRALNSIGHFEELERYSHFIQNVASSEEERFQPVYKIDAEKEITERQIDLAGYEGSGPVRVGNQAYVQKQHDVYGQLLVSLLPLFVDKRIITKSRLETPHLLKKLLKGIEATIEEPDAGIWEFRGKAMHHCYTDLFHWAGTSAAMKIAQKLKDDQLHHRARHLNKLASDRLESYYDQKTGVYQAAIGHNYMDAALFHLITMNYIDPSSEKAARQLKVLEEQLKANSTLFYRYRHEDDFGKPEVTFAICGLWYVQVLAMMGRVDEAMENFDKFLKYSNHLGLFSEDIDATDGSQWGNFPQTYTHVGLINVACLLEQKLTKPEFL